MKLRNKKTGEITTRIDVSESGEKFWVLGKKPCMYDTLAELNAEWEDYTPAEPLIKDEKIRKAVRAWAEAEKEDCYYGYNSEILINGSGDSIEFWCKPFADLKAGEHYTISELCGEEE